jgi:hypothetical protein
VSEALIWEKHDWLTLTADTNSSPIYRRDLPLRTPPFDAGRPFVFGVGADPVFSAACLSAFRNARAGKRSGHAGLIVDLDRRGWRFL